MSQFQLTKDAIAKMCRAEGKNTDNSFVPILQVLKVIQVSNSMNSNNERYRAILSDGTHFVQGMLASQQNNLIKSGQLKEWSIVTVTEFMSNTVQGKRVVIVLNLDLVGKANSKIGTPVDIEKSAAPAVSSSMNMPSQPQAAPPLYGNQSYNNGNARPQNTYSNNNRQPRNTYSSSSNTRNPYGATSSSAPIVRSNNAISAHNYTPISALNMYQNRWTIKARVTSKSDIRYWSNAKGEGSLFSFELLDNSGMDVRATMFKEAVDKFYNMLEEGKVYTFSGGRLKVANMQYNTCKCGFEITFDQNAEIHLDNDSGEIQQQLFEFEKIANISNVEPGKNVDVIAIVKNVGAVGTIVSKKSGHELTKCELELVDDSGAEISLTVWGERAQKAEIEYANCPIVAFRRVRVSDFGGRTLSASGSSPVTKYPQVPESDQLQRWWNDMGGSTASTTRLSNSRGGGAGRVSTLEERKNIAAIKKENLGFGEKPDWVSFKATFNWLKNDKEGGAWYTACPNPDEPCKQRVKVTQTTDGNYHCERCNQTFENCMRRFIFSGTLCDDTSTTWVSLFDEQAKVLLDGISADECYEKTHAIGDTDAYNSVFDKALFTEWIFTCKVKQEMVQDEMRVKTTVYSLHPVDYVKESRDLISAIQKIKI